MAALRDHAIAVDPEPSRGQSDALWAAVDRLVDRAPRCMDLSNHRLELFGARRRRATGRPVPPELLVLERRSAATLVSVSALLARVREFTDEPLLLFKGLEVAARYPDSVLRTFRDIDLISADAAETQRALVAGGFQEVGDPKIFRDIYHLRPLRWPGLPILIEVHSRPKWVAPLEPPSADSLFAGAGPAQAVEGFFAPSPARHAVLLAVHSWAHEPLRILRDLVDVAALAAEASAEETEAVAREWGVDRLWSTTTAARDFLFAGGPRPLSTRIWAQNLSHVRERTVLESHIQRWLSDLWALPMGRALRRLPKMVVSELGPEGGEPWRQKISRSALAVKNAARRRSEHDRQAGVR